MLTNYTTRGMVWVMIGMILLLFLMFVGALMATNSFWWSVAIVLFTCVAAISPYWAVVILVPSLLSLFLFQSHRQ